MVKVFINGKMVECILDNMHLIKNKVLEGTTGVMEEYMKVIGKMEREKDKER